MSEKKKTLSFNEIRINEQMTILKTIKKENNLSFKEAYDYAETIDSYKYGGNFKRGNKYRGDDEIILKFLPQSKIKNTNKKSLLNK